MGRKSLTRKEILHYEEPFVRAVKATIRWIVQNYILILVVVGAGLALSFGYTAWKTQRQRISEQTSKELTEAVASLQDLMNNPPQDSKELEKALSDVESKLKSIMDKYRGTQPALEAAYHLGEIALYKGSYGEALKKFDEAVNLPEPLRSLARLGQVQALMGLQKYDEALKTLDLLKSDPERTVGDDLVLYFQARILKRNGDKEHFQKVLEELKKVDPESPWIAELERMSGNTLSSEKNGA